MNSPRNLNLELVEEALCWLGTKEEKEKGDNKGTEVEMFQKAVNGIAEGEPWCMAFVQFLIKLIEDKYSIQCLVFKSEHCMTVFRNSTPKVVKTPQVGDLVIWRMGNTASGHVGIIVRLLGDGRMETIEGNTSDSTSIERNGDGVYLKNRSMKGSDSFRIMGYIRPF